MDSHRLDPQAGPRKLETGKHLGDSTAQPSAVRVHQCRLPSEPKVDLVAPQSRSQIALCEDRD